MTKYKWAIPVVVIGLVLLSLGRDEAQLEPLSPDAVILALGDSLTYGTGVDREDSYPAVLEAEIGLQVINAGIPGETTSGTLARITEVLDQHRPNLVILCIGGNDILRRRSKAEIVTNLQRLIDIVQEHEIQLVLLAVPEFGLYPSAPDFYAELAESNGIPLDDETIPSVLRNPTLKSDAIHGNEAGYREIALGVKQLLQQSGAL